MSTEEIRVKQQHLICRIESKSSLTQKLEAAEEFAKLQFELMKQDIMKKFAPQSN